MRERDLLAVFEKNCSLSANTCAAYKTSATTLMTQFDTTDLYQLLKDADKTLGWILRKYGGSDASKKNMIAAVLAIFKHNKGLDADLAKAHKKWRAAFEELSEKIDERYKANRPSDKQNDGYVPFNEIVAMRDSLPHGSMDRLLLAMYTYIRPLRGDFNKVRIYTMRTMPRQTEDNYVHVPTRVLVLNEYKTARHNGEYRRELPPALITEIKESLAKRPRDYLFVKLADGTPYELANSYVRYANNTLKRLFQRPLTLSLIRHSFISSLDFNTLSITEKEEIAQDMAHTVQMQDKYRFIFDKKEQD
jgi:integrase